MNRADDLAKRIGEAPPITPEEALREMEEIEREELRGEGAGIGLTWRDKLRMLVRRRS